MKDSTTPVAKITMTSLELVDNRISELLLAPEKDYEWYCEFFDYIDTSEHMSGCRNIQKALVMAAGSLFYDHLKATSETEKLKNSLYIMESMSMGAVKIGRTWIDVKKRALQLKVGCPDICVVAVFEGVGAIEPTIHRLLKDFCIGGEWFSISGDMATSIVKKEIDSGRSS